MTVLKRAYFMTVIDGVFCVNVRACDRQTRDAFQLTGVNLWAVTTLQTLW